MTALGGIPWQVYFQRVLSCQTDFDARMLSYLSATGCIFLAIPPAVIGAAAKTANFTAAGYLGPYNLRTQDTVRVLPYSIYFLTSGLVSILGLLGITAAIMSSVDSSMLSASLLVTKNIYQAIVRPTASDAEVALVLRMMVFLIGSWATYLALSVESVFEVWSLSSEVVYVLLFPQLLCLLYFKHSNTYGSLTAFIVGCCFRWLLGEPSLGVPMSITLPLYDEERGQGFPLRLTCMAFGVATIVITSYGATTVFENGWLPAHYDVFHCCHHKQHGRIHSAVGASHVPDSAHVPAAGPVQSEAPKAVPAPQARRSSRSPRKDSKAAAEDEAPDPGAKDVVPTDHKASTASSKSTAVDAEKARKVSGQADMGKHRRMASLALKHESKGSTNVDVTWHPMRNVKSEHEAKDEVKVDGSQASGSGSSRSRRHLSRNRSKTETAAAGGASNSIAAAPEPEDKARKERR
ncbi:high-affinity choline transporter 1-like [Amblyomma americanum]